METNVISPLDTFPEEKWLQILNAADVEAKTNYAKASPSLKRLILEQSITLLLLQKDVSHTREILEKSEDPQKESRRQQLLSKLEESREFIFSNAFKKFTAEEIQFLREKWTPNMGSIDELEDAINGHLEFPLLSIILKETKTQRLFSKIFPHISPMLDSKDEWNCSMVCTMWREALKPFLYTVTTPGPELTEAGILLANADPWLSSGTFEDWPTLEISCDVNTTVSVKNLFQNTGIPFTGKSLSIVIFNVEMPIVTSVFEQLEKFQKRVQHLKLTLAASVKLRQDEYFQLCVLLLKKFRGLQSLILKNFMQVEWSTFLQTFYSDLADYTDKDFCMSKITTLVLHSKSSTYAIDKNLVDFLCPNLRRLVILKGDVYPHWVDNLNNPSQIRELKLAYPIKEFSLKVIPSQLQTLSLNLDTKCDEAELLKVLRICGSSVKSIQLKINKNVHSFSTGLLLQSDLNQFNAITKFTLVFDNNGPVTFDFLLMFPKLEVLSLRFKNEFKPLGPNFRLVNTKIKLQLEHVLVQYIRLNEYLTKNEEPFQVRSSNIWSFLKNLQTVEVVISDQQNSSRNVRTFKREN